MAEEKSFSYFLDLPPETRMLMVDKMEVKDRTRCSGCSKFCNKEVKKSKNYIYELKFHFIDAFPLIFVIHGTHENGDESRKGYMLKYKEERGEKLIQCESLKVGLPQLWETKISNSTNLVQLAIDYFKNYLKQYQNTIKELDIVVSHPSFDSTFINFEIKNLNNLKKVYLFGGVDVQQLLSKTRKGLTHLSVQDDINGKLLENCEQIYQVQEYFRSPHTQFNNEQLLQLSASTVKIPIGRLTEQNIFNFVRYWQNGTLRKKVESYEWNLKDSKFDVKKMFQLFRVDHDGTENKVLEIKHDEEPGKMARLKFRNYGGFHTTIQLISSESNEFYN